MEILEKLKLELGILTMRLFILWIKKLKDNTKSENLRKRVRPFTGQIFYFFFDFDFDFDFALAFAMNYGALYPY